MKIHYTLLGALLLTVGVHTAHGQELPLTDDPAKEWCYLRKSTTVIGMPFHPQVTEVTYDGSLYTGHAELNFSYGPHDTPILIRQKTFEEGWIPVVGDRWNDGDIEYRIAIYSAPLDTADVSNCVNFVKVTMTNTGKEKAHALFNVSTRGKKADYRLAALQGFSDDNEYLIRDNALYKDNRLLFTFNDGYERIEAVEGTPYTAPFTGSSLRITPETRTAIVRYDRLLKPRQQAELVFKMPCVPVADPAQAQRIAQADYEAYHTATVAFWKNLIGSQTRFEINNTFSLDTFRPVMASGRFNPSINLNSLGNIEITGIPEFLTDGDVRADLDNPRIMVSIDNTMNATGLVSGTIIATKDGHESAKVTVPQMTVHPATTTHICICRKKTAEIEAEYGSNAYEVPDLSTLIEKIPDNISFDAKAMADKDRESEFMLDHTYTIKPSYTVEAPIAFAENASIVYKDSLDGWHEDLEDYDLSDDAAVCVTATIENRVPAYLTLTATPIDTEGNDISSDVNVEVSNTVIASPDGENSAYTPLTINITKKTADAMRKIDGLRLTIQGKAKSDDGTESVTGKTLNAKKHFLIVRDLKIKITGKVIADFN